MLALILWSIRNRLRSKWSSSGNWVPTTLNCGGNVGIGDAWSTYWKAQSIWHGRLRIPITSLGDVIAVGAQALMQPLWEHDGSELVIVSTVTQSDLLWRPNSCAGDQHGESQKLGVPFNLVNWNRSSFLGSIYQNNQSNHQFESLCENVILLLSFVQHIILSNNLK